jgi:phosphatidylinositol kinase/protein kinase (PI-3  family)
MDMPQNLQRISKSHLVMPIEENLSVQLPPKNYSKNYQLSSLVSTTKDICEFNKENADIEDFIAKSAGHIVEPEESKDQSAQVAGAELTSFSAYKEDPVMLSSFQPKVVIMHSKEKPKKIGIVGSDGQTYNFLLKCDKYGDLRKEQRFIDFAVLCNKMLEGDAEARKRNLRLRTYAIVPLSRNTGLIEWI